MSKMTDVQTFDLSQALRLLHRRLGVTATFWPTVGCILLSAGSRQRILEHKEDGRGCYDRLSRTANIVEKTTAH